MSAGSDLTPGKIRGLTATSTDGGVFAVLAIDHRDSMRAVLDPGDPDGVPASELTAVKLLLAKEMGREATAVMLDPEYSAAQAIVARAVPGRVGFLAAIEAQGYLGDPEARQTSLLDGWSIEKAKRLGASGIKLLVLYLPGAGEVTEAQDQMIRAVVAECRRYDIPLFLEPLAYDIEPSQRRAVVIDTVKRLAALGPDVLKVQFPLDASRGRDPREWADACSELNDASQVPWALLSGGDRYETFREQVRAACAAGASGFMVGRALWREAVTAPPEERSRLIEEVVRPRFHELRRIAEETGRDWASWYVLPEVDATWYLQY